MKDAHQRGPLLTDMFMGWQVPQTLDRKLRDSLKKEKKAGEAAPGSAEGFGKGCKLRSLTGKNHHWPPLAKGKHGPGPIKAFVNGGGGVGRWGGAGESCEGNFAVLLLVGHGRGRIWFCEFPLDVAFETSEKECPSIRKSFSSGTGKRTGTPQDRNLCFAPA